MTRLEYAARLDAMGVNASMAAHSMREVLRIRDEIAVESVPAVQTGLLVEQYERLAAFCRKRADELRESDA